MSCRTNDDTDDFILFYIEFIHNQIILISPFVITHHGYLNKQEKVNL